MQLENLGIHSIVKCPVIIDKDIVARSMMPDQQIDGRGIIKESSKMVSACF
jgi:hypothetical protein